MVDEQAYSKAIVYPGTISMLLYQIVWKIVFYSYLLQQSSLLKVSYAQLKVFLSNPCNMCVVWAAGCLSSFFRSEISDISIENKLHHLPVIYKQARLLITCGLLTNLRKYLFSVMLGGVMK